ncbi:MAG: thiol reductant ABC exporter subunit CydC [Enterobacterales bacterium]
MKKLIPFIKIYIRYYKYIIFSILLSIITLISSISLLSISGWLLVSSFLSGNKEIYKINILFSIIIRIIALVRIIGKWGERVINHDITLRILQNIRIYIFECIIPISNTLSSNIKYSDILNSLISDVDTLSNLYIKIFSPFLIALIISILLSLHLLFLNIYLGLTVGIILLSTLIIFPFIFYYYSKFIGNHIINLRSKYRSQLNTYINNHSEISVYNSLKKYRKNLNKTENLWILYQKKHTEMISISKSLILIITGLILYISLYIITKNKLNNIYCLIYKQSLIPLSIFSILASLEVLKPIADSFQNLGQIISAISRINKLINQKSNVKFPINGIKPENRVSIVINKIKFRYPNYMKFIINSLSLNVNCGEHIAITGHTGCGKSTLLKLLTRTYDPQYGTIKINGKLIQQWSEKSLRSMISITPQKIHIFNATLRDNLLLASPNVDDLTLEKIINSVQLDYLLKNNGLSKWIGEGGRQLSFGEQRRIGIARTLLHASPLWLLDEPTEGLDMKTEKKIIELIITLGVNHTIIIITHKLKILLNYVDKIYTINNGKIIK